ncbi:MAG: hypothetical protein AABX79_01850, partial [Nanoarchaeota archaeon]
GSLAANSINTTYILDGTIAAADIVASAINTTHIIEGTILAGDIAVSAINTTHILDNTILSQDIAIGAINATRIGVVAVNSTHVGAAAINSSAIDANAINTTHISSMTILAGDISAGAINSTHIAISAINTTHILDNTILPIDLNSDVNATIDIRELTNTSLQVFQAVDNGTFLKISQWNATNTSYLTDYGDTATGNYTFDTNTFFIDSSGNLVGIGTAAPAAKLHINTTDNTTTAMRIEGLNSTGGNATWLFIQNASGNVGIGTTTPTGGKLNIFGGNLNLSGNNITNVLKITLDTGGTIDPPYRVGDTIYATYSPFIVGSKEEVTGTIKLNSSYVIDFKNLEKGSDLWLFYQVTDFGKNMENLQVILTPSFNGKVWYQKDPVAKTLIIHGDSSGEVSYRMTSNSWNWKNWGNIARNLDVNSYVDMGEKK